MARRSDLSILVVDDMSVSRQVLVQMLESFGVRDTATASCGAEAITWLRAHRADLVIADLHMPGMDGVRLLEDLRHSPKTRGIRFVLTNADDASPRFALARALGIDALLVKPFRRDRLLATVEDIAGRI